MSRCTQRGCPVRYASGPDRPCLLHRDDRAPSVAGRMAMYGAVLEAAPGEHDDEGEA